MKKFIRVFALAAVLSTLSAATAFAGSWKQDQAGWWWQDKDKTYPVSSWKWIDSNGDGLAECYYFDQNGYLLTGILTPDGYQVNDSGAWIDEGIVRQKAATPFAARSIDEEGYRLYNEADQKSSSLPGLDIHGDFRIAFSYEGLTIPLTMKMQLKYHDLTMDNMEYLSALSLEMLGSKMEQTSFYTNGCYYSDSGQEGRYKMEINPVDMTEHLTFGGFAGQFGAFLNNMQISEDDAGNKILFYSSNEKELEQYLQELFNQMAPSFSGYDMKIQSLSGKAVLTPEGYFSREVISVFMTLTEEGETMVVRMDLNIDYNHPGQPVSIEFPTTEGYQELVY